MNAKPADWQDAPAVREARALCGYLLAVLSQPAAQAEAELAAHGLYPVSVVHGYPEDAVSAELAGTVLPGLAARFGSTASTGRGDLRTWLFPSPRAAATFGWEAAAVMEPWWRITATPAPVYGKMDALDALLMPGLHDGIYDVIGPGTDWERVINAWCEARAFIDGNQDPGKYQQRALRRFSPAFRAAALGHVTEWDPAPAPDTRKWTCRRCYRPVCVVGGVTAGSAVTGPCPGKAGRPELPPPLTPAETAAFRAQALPWLRGHPKATTSQVQAALGCADLALDELHAMADEGLLAIRNMGGYIGWEARR